MSNNNEIERIEYKGYAIVVYPDDTIPENPREWSNLGTMACWHRQYTMGDVQPNNDPIEYMAELLWNMNVDLPDDYTDKQVIKLFNQYFINLPIFAYEHSGITISTSNRGYPFNDIWDSGQLGFIFVSKDNVRKEYTWKRLTDKRIKKIQDYLRGEIETYDDYLTGNVYGYAIYEIPEDCEDIDDIDLDMADSLDSVWGYYGDYHDYMLSECKTMIDHWIEKKNKAILIEHESIFSNIPLFVGL